MRAGREVGRQRKERLLGHLSVGLGRSLQNNGKALQNEQCHTEYVPVQLNEEERRDVSY